MAAKFGNIQSAYDPYSGMQISAIRYSGYRKHQFHMSELDRQTTLAQIKAGARIVCGFALVAVGFYVLNLLG